MLDVEPGLPGYLQKLITGSIQSRTDLNYTKETTMKKALLFIAGVCGAISALFATMPGTAKATPAAQPHDQTTRMDTSVAPMVSLDAMSRRFSAIKDTASECDMD